MQTVRTFRSVLAFAAIAALAIAAVVRAEPLESQSKDQPKVQRIEVPAGDLVAALESLSRQVRVSLIYQPDQMQGLKTEGANGTLTPREAVLLLLRGSDLRLSVDESTGALLITSPTATLRRTSEESSAKEPAQGAMHSESFGGGRQIEVVVVTGSMLTSSVAAEEGAAPVRVLSIETIRRNGATTVYEALRSMPELAGYADNDSRSGARDTREINLRGLGAQYTVVLVNGRRLGQNNLNLVPFAAVERIEILKDGASAVYGSDALAGVVNVILRRDYDGVELAADYGNSTHFADAGKTNVSVLFGSRTERGSFVLSGQYEKQTPALSSEHPLGQSDDQRRYGGRDLRFQRQNPGLIRLADGSEVMLNPSFSDGATGSSAADYVAPYDNKIDKLRLNNLQNGREVGTFFGSGTYLLGKVELLADFLYRSAEIDYIDHRGTLLDLDVPASNYWNPFGQDVHVTYLLDATTAGEQERGLESLTSDMRTHMVTLGAKGTLGPIAYDIAHTDWRGSDMQTHDGLSRAGVMAQLARSDPGALNVFGHAAVMPEQLQPARALFRRELTEFARSTTGIFTFRPFTLPAGPAAAAVGFEFRNQGFASLLDESLSRYRDSLSLVFLNDISIRADREVEASFAELQLPLAGRGGNASPALEVTLAARRESFSDFGAATVQRGTLRWRPLDDDVVTVRASYSESFYAPELRDIQPLGDVNFGPQNDPLILDANGLPLRYTMTQIAGGNPDLDPTTGEYRNLGVILKPAFAAGLRLTLDLWRLDQKDAFVYPSVQAVINGTGPGLVTRHPVPLPGEPIGRIVTVVNRAENAAQRTVQGVDFSISYRRQTQRDGYWGVELHNTFTTRFDFDQKDGRGVRNALGLLGPVFDTVPRFRSNLILSSGFGALQVSLATNYIAPVSNTFDDYRQIEPYVRSNLTLRYAAPGDTEVWFGLQDVFDRGAPYVGALRTQGIVSDFTYVDYIGQFWTVGFRSRF